MNVYRTPTPREIQTLACPYVRMSGILSGDICHQTWETDMRRFRLIMLLAVAVCLSAISFARAAAPAKPSADDKLNPFTDVPEDPLAKLSPIRRAQLAKKQMAAMRLNKQLMQQFAAKEYEQSVGTAQQICELVPEHPTVWQNLSLAYCRTNDTDKALDNLEKSIDLGYTKMWRLEKMPSFAPLRELPRFKALRARRDKVQKEKALLKLADLKTRYGDDYIVEIDHKHKLIFATNVDRATLDELKTDLPARAEALWKHLLTYEFEEYITIIIPAAGSVESSNISGLYRHSGRLVVAKGIGWPVRHEFAHALHMGDCEARTQPNHPLWIKEGLATLYERSDLRDGKLVPLPSNRINQLKTRLETKNVYKLSVLVRLNQKQAMKYPGAFYSMVRNLMRYLHEHNKLKPFYTTYVKFHQQDPSGRKALEAVVGKDIMEFEKDWHAWVRKQPAFGITSKTFLGFGAADASEGLRVQKLAPDGPAARAGLQAGDLIVALGGKIMADSMDIVSVLNATKPGDEVPVRYRRKGKYIEAKIKSIERPADQAAPELKTGKVDMVFGVPTGVSSRA